MSIYLLLRPQLLQPRELPQTAFQELVHPWEAPEMPASIQLGHNPCQQQHLTNSSGHHRCTLFSLTKPPDFFSYRNLKDHSEGFMRIAKAWPSRMYIQYLKCAQFEIPASKPEIMWNQNVFFIRDFHAGVLDPWGPTLNLTILGSWSNLKSQHIHWSYISSSRTIIAQTTY